MSADRRVLSRRLYIERPPDDVLLLNCPFQALIMERVYGISLWVVVIACAILPLAHWMAAGPSGEGALGGGGGGGCDDDGQDQCRAYLAILRTQVPDASSFQDHHLMLAVWQSLSSSATSFLPAMETLETGACSPEQIQHAYIRMGAMLHAAGAAVLFQVPQHSHITRTPHPSSLIPHLSSLIPHPQFGTSVLVEVTRTPLLLAQLYSAVGAVYYASDPARIPFVATPYHAGLAACTLCCIVALHLFYRLMYQAKTTPLRRAAMALAFYMCLYLARLYDSDTNVLPLLLVAYYCVVPSSTSTHRHLTLLYAPIMMCYTYVHHHHHCRRRLVPSSHIPLRPDTNTNNIHPHFHSPSPHSPPPLTIDTYTAGSSTELQTT